MVIGLKRYQDVGDLHFTTFSCFRRLGYLRAPVDRDLFEDGLERVRRRYEFEVVGYVIMPEHVRLLVSEPRTNSLATALQALKLSVARRSERGQFWQARYYDFNVYSDHKRFEKLDYMHWNPVKRGLVERMEDWHWSSYRFYRTGQQGRAFIQSGWVKQYKPD
ncbi:MAG: REP-associated tyrosine transposase [Acidobacteriaceae bacterium]|jgi:putative transposase|nr:REP-associated tyrosine transposase [Acidobacteriaceae bacterium]